MARCFACSIYRPTSMCRTCVVSDAFNDINDAVNVLNQCMDNLGGRSVATFTLLRAALMELEERDRVHYINNLLQNPPRRSGLFSCLEWIVRVSVQVLRRVFYLHADDALPGRVPSSIRSQESVQYAGAQLNQAEGMPSHGISSYASNSPSISYEDDPDYTRTHSVTPSSSDESLVPSSGEEE
ncbi:uncharacterized protein LOC107004170 [Solanum pennellii]|uniref:Uncharacterized protein LOC107004170 n=1 Tax=Solanum pennellii TaxID=28526 RepID=A0ABM1FJP3_SOLPN|nr:uncharacterized protein LOC107004170 [Solanum pennellii]